MVQQWVKPKQAGRANKNSSSFYRLHNMEGILVSRSPKITVFLVQANFVLVLEKHFWYRFTSHWVCCTYFETKDLKLKFQDSMQTE